MLLIGAAATARVADAQTAIGPGQDQCDVPDIDECASKPCANGAACTDSLVDPTIPHREYRCACRAGFANGTCAVGWIAAVRQYAGLCAAAAGNCDVDLDECLSRPCSAGTVCYDRSATTRTGARRMSRTWTRAPATRAGTAPCAAERHRRPPSYRLGLPWDAMRGCR